MPGFSFAVLRGKKNSTVGFDILGTTGVGGVLLPIFLPCALCGFGMAGPCTYRHHHLLRIVGLVVVTVAVV